MSGKDTIPTTSPPSTTGRKRCPFSVMTRVASASVAPGAITAGAFCETSCTVASFDACAISFSVRRPTTFSSSVTTAAASLVSRIDRPASATKSFGDTVRTVGTIRSRTSIAITPSGKCLSGSGCTKLMRCRRGELEVPDLDRRRTRPAEEQLGRGFGGVADAFDVAEGFDCVLRETQVLYPAREFPVLDREGPVSGHAG